MSTAKHTPGPWIATKNADVVAGNTNGLIADAFDGLPHYETDKHIAVANARLIAAAPDLLEALKSAMDHIQMLEEGIEELRQLGATANFCGVSFSHEKARAAIAKAEGGAR